jgi:hypothetical protein
LNSAIEYHQEIPANQVGQKLNRTLKFFAYGDQVNLQEHDIHVAVQRKKTEDFIGRSKDVAKYMFMFPEEKPGQNDKKRDN